MVMGARGPYLPSFGIGKYCRFLSRQMGKEVVVQDSLKKGCRRSQLKVTKWECSNFVETVQASRQGKEYKSKIG